MKVNTCEGGQLSETQNCPGRFLFKSYLMLVFHLFQLYCQVRKRRSCIRVFQPAQFHYFVPVTTQNYAWYDEQQFFRSIPILHFRVILSLWCKARLSAKLFAVAAPDLWNSLPDSIRSCDYLSTFESDLHAGLSFIKKAYHVNTAIFILTFTYLLFNSLFICSKSEIFTYCSECGVRRLGQGWIGAIQIFNHYYLIIIIIITIITIDMKFFFLILIYINLILTTKVLHLVSFWKREFLELGSGLLE